MLGSKKETQRLPNIGHPHLKTDEDAPLSWVVRSSARHLTGRMVLLNPPENCFQHIPASSRKAWLTVEGSSATIPHTEECELTSHTCQSSNLRARTTQEHFQKLPNLMHQAPYTNKRPHCAAVAAVATFKVRRSASAGSPRNSNPLCLCQSCFSRRLPRCSSYSYLQSRDHDTE